MATNLDLDPKLVERALKVSGKKTKKEAVTAALKEFIARRDQARILDLFGKLDWDPEYNYKSERTSPISHPEPGGTHRSRRFAEPMPEARSADRDY